MITADSCSSICKFIYKDLSWAGVTGHKSLDKQTVAAGSVTGVVSISLQYFSGSDEDEFRFMDNDYYRKRLLAFKVYCDEPKIGLFGRTLSGEIYGEQDVDTEGGKPTKIQVSDLINTDFYKLFLGVGSEAKSRDYNFGSDQNWSIFQSPTANLRLSDTTRIRTKAMPKGSEGCTAVEYISACSSPTPILCDTDASVSLAIQLGTALTLTCSGSGAPYLGVSWTKGGLTLERTTEIIYEDSRADHFIKSTLVIESPSLTDLGIWTCTIFNKNFKNSVTRTYELTYSSEVRVMIEPDLDYYKREDGGMLTWVVEGWPLTYIALDCGGISSVSIKYDTNENSYFNSNPPKMKITLSLATEDIVTCILKDGDRILDTRTITRVGYNCEAGEMGVAKICEDCPFGHTSPAGSADCFAATSSCVAGEYGVLSCEDDDCLGNDPFIINTCEICPLGKISDRGAVKKQECFEVDQKNCEAGTYGHDGTCTECPDGETSLAGFVKEQECELKTSYCTVGNFGVEGACTPCPDGQISLDSAVKVQECFKGSSSCVEGTYGVGNSCTDCPQGQTSNDHTVKEEECITATSTCKVGSWGRVDGICYACPRGEISPVHTVKIQECYQVSSNCEAGMYGIGDNCAKCPIGRTSEENSVKIQECKFVSNTCEEGEYGVGNNCLACPKGKSSIEQTVKIQDCEQKESNCLENEYGILSDCKTCPKGQISLPYSVKIQECNLVESACEAGTYGYDGSCTKCPVGEVSKVGSVKIQECSSAKSNCKEGEYGIDDNCNVCPHGTNSIQSTVKEQDCEIQPSNCAEGDYGVGNECTPCPQGQISTQGAVKEQDCITATSNCEAGTFGVNDQCSNCPMGQTSHSSAVKQQECLLVNSNCEIGLWGKENNCASCPKGQISLSNAVKVQECNSVVSTCDAGEYGYNGSCTKCPVGELSEVGSVKIQECSSAKSNCKEGEYGIDDNCNVCPHGTNSIQSTVKEQDCEIQPSNCAEGDYGVGNDCTPCPQGQISTQGAVKEQDCITATSNCEPGTFGVNDQCSNCPMGQTSHSSAVKQQECLLVNSNCKIGLWGKENDCKSCPKGQISLSNAVKVQECYSVESTCEAGTYGYNGTCTNCPTGKISEVGSVKIEDCTEVDSVCSEGWYGTYKNCALCPTGLISSNHTVKVQDCQNVTSTCTEGTFGVGQDCSPCPNGTISNNTAVKIQECSSATSFCKEGSYGVDSECLSCPMGQVSPPSAVKIQECFSVNSSCTEGFWGVDDECNPCPDGQISKQNTVKIQGCFAPNRQRTECTNGEQDHENADFTIECLNAPAMNNTIQTIGIASSMVGLAIVLCVSGLIYFRRRSSAGSTTPELIENLVTEGMNSTNLDPVYSNADCAINPAIVRIDGEEGSCHIDTASTACDDTYSYAIFNKSRQVNANATDHHHGNGPQMLSSEFTYAALRVNEGIQESSALYATLNQTVNVPLVSKEDNDIEDEDTYACLNRSATIKFRKPDQTKAHTENDDSSYATLNEFNRDIEGAHINTVTYNSNAGAGSNEDKLLVNPVGNEDHCYAVANIKRMSMIGTSNQMNAVKYNHDIDSEEHVGDDLYARLDKTQSDKRLISSESPGHLKSCTDSNTTVRVEDDSYATLGQLLSLPVNEELDSNTAEESMYANFTTNTRSARSALTVTSSASGR